MRQSHNKVWLQVRPMLAISVIYFVVTKIALALVELDPNAGSLWPAPGIVFAAMVLYGTRLWPGVFVGAFFALVTGENSNSAGAALLMATGNTIESVAGTWLALRAFDFHKELDRPRDVIVLFIPVALVTSLISASVGMWALYLDGMVTADTMFPRAIVWWLGDALGIAIIAPLILTLRSGASKRPTRTGLHNWYLLILCAAVLLTFTTPPRLTWIHYLAEFSIFVIGVWCALEAGRRALARASLAIAIIVIAGTSQGLGPFTEFSAIYSSIVQQGYVYALALMMMVLSAARAQQRQSQRELRASEARFRQLLKLSSDWYWEQDRDFRFVDLSSEVQQQTGIEPKQHFGKARWELPELALSEADWQAHRAQLEAHQPFRDFVMRRPDHDGKLIFISVSGEPMFDEAGVFAGYRGVGRNISEMRVAEQALRDSEERFRTLWETTNDTVLIVDEHGIVQFANPAVQATFGYAPQEMLGQSLANIQPVTLRAAHTSGMQRFAETGDRRLDWRGTETTGRHRDGHEFPIEIMFSEIPVNGRRGFVGFIRDISKRKEAERELHRSRALFATIFESSPIPIFISRVSDGRFFEANQACFELFGFTREQVMGKTTLEIGLWPNEADRERLLALLRAEGRAVNYDIKLRTADGQLIDVMYSAQVVELNAEQCIVATIVDVTARKRAEELQREYEQRFAKVFHSSPDAIVISRLSDGVYLEVNDAWARLSGYPKEEALGKSAFDLNIWVEPEDRQLLVSKLTAGNAVRQFDFQFRRKDGQVAQALMSAEVIELRGEKCLLSLLADVTERRRAVEQLRESERRFADVVDAAGEYVWETDPTGHYIYVSERIERVLGYTAQEMIGRESYDFMPAEEIARLELWFDTRQDPGMPIRNLEHISITKDGRQIWQQVSGVPIFNAAGERIGYRGTGMDITERKLAEQRIEELATRDALTQLPNRRLLTDRLSQGILAAQRSGGLIAVLFIDLDRFKTINDSLGHAAGDELLRGVAERLQLLMRKGDTLARIGGDEFVVLLEALRVPEDAGAVAQKIIATLSEPYMIAGNTLSTSASVGISVFPGDAPDGPTLVRNADMAMYFAKEHGRRNYQYYSEEMNARAIEKLTMESTLRRAIEREEFELYYHPKFNLADGQLAGIEALVRWNHPELGVVGPGRFIPVTEETGLIVPLGEWVLRRACRQSHDWAQTFRCNVPMAVNLSVGQFNKGLTRTVRDALAAADLPPSALELEITESMLMNNVDENIDVLRRLSDLGVAIAIDDFGTGYSSLAYLRRFHVDTLKIDQSFVRDVETNLDDAAIIEAIIALGHSLKLTVVAEGVETAGQKRQLLELNCDQCQGFLFGPPVPAAIFEAKYLQ